MDIDGSRHLWRFEPADPGLTSEIREAAGVSNVVAQVLASRGVGSGIEAASYLLASVDSLADPTLLPDADKVVDRVSLALERRETIVVHGHDDADGVTATTIMLETLAQLGTDARSYIPDRRTEGHGLNAAEIDGLAAAGATLIITVDSCVSDVSEIAHASRVGVDVVVTDHHEIPPALPDAAAVVNPKLPGSLYPYPYLAGVGVALRVADLLLAELSGQIGRGSAGRSWFGPAWRGEALALAALGSVADRVPLTGENRVIASAGLARLPATERPGLVELLKETQLWGREIEPDDVLESLGPVFGRVSDGAGANRALDLLLAREHDTARDLAAALVSERQRWRSSAASAWKTVKAELARSAGGGESLVTVVESEIPLGVLGYVASRAASDTGRPTILVARKNGTAMGEARGPAGFNLVDALNSMSDLFDGHGGHPRAAGFTIASDRLAELRLRMSEYAAAHPPDVLRRQIDAVLQLEDAIADVAREIESLGPFGQGNRPAVLLARGVTRAAVNEARKAGLRFRTPFTAGDRPIDIVYRLRDVDGVPFVGVLDTSDTSADRAEPL